MAEILVFSDTDFWVRIPVEEGKPLVFREGVAFWGGGNSSIHDYDITRWVGPKYVREKGKDRTLSPHDVLRPVARMAPRMTLSHHIGKVE